MELSVIENDHIEVKKYLENFVPDNYYRVLGDAYLYQVRAVLQHAVRNAGEYNVRYDSLINSLTAQFEQNRVNIGQEISAWGNKHTVHAQRLTYLEAENNTVSASITELEKIIISNNKAILEKTNKLAAQLVDFEVGGVNLIHNSTFAKGYKAVGDVAITTSDHVLGTLFKIVNLADVEEEIGIGSLVEFNKIKLMEGKQYTLSFYGFGSVELINNIKLNKGDLVHTLDPIIMDSDISNRKTLTFIAPFSGDDIGFSIGTVGYPIDSWFSLVAIQLELGSRATDWSPSPFDNADYIARVAASLEEVRKITIEQQAVNVAAIDTLRANIGETKGQIVNEREINLSKFSSMTRQLDELTSSTAGNTSRITNLDNTYTDKFTANAEKLVELEANIGASNAAITRVDEVVSTNTSAIATSTNNLSAKIDGIKIGGRNLIRNSTFKLGHEAWGDATIIRKDTVLGSEVTVTNNGSAQFGIQNDVLFHTISLVEGDEYTLSFYGNGNIPSINSIWLKSEGKDPQLLSEIAIDAVLAEKKVLTFTSTITADNVSIIIAAAGYPKDSWFKIVALQLEKGNKATDWTEAPEDIVNFISGVEANIDEFKEVQVGINGATATQIDTLNTKTDNSNAAIDELRETTSNIEGSTATLETKLRGEYTSAVSTAKSDITRATDGKIDAVKVTLREMTTDISSKADITRVDSVENNAKQSLATAKTELTSSYTSAISTVRTESATDATNKANKAKTDANTYTDGKVTTLTTLVNSKASISRVDDVENNANQALASTKTELTGEYTSAISLAKEESATDAQNKAEAAKEYAEDLVDSLTTIVNSKADITRVDKVVNDSTQALAQAKTDIKGAYTLAITESSELSAADAQAKADKALADATIKATEAQTAAETYALAEANAKAAAALDSAKSDATTKANKAKADAELAAALDAKNKADEALRLAKLDATAKADAVKDMVVALTTVVDSKASISRVDTIENNANQALATAKTELTSEYTSSISKAIGDIEIGGRNLFILSKVGRFYGSTNNPNSGSVIIEGTRLSAPVSFAGLIGNTVKVDGDNIIVSGRTDLEGQIRCYYKYDNSGQPTFMVPVVNGRFEFAMPVSSGAHTLYIGLGQYPWTSPHYIEDVKIEQGTKATAWTPAPEDTIGYIDSEITKVNTKVDSKADITRVDSIENTAAQSLATAKTDITSSYTSAIATAKSQSATDAQTKATAALNAAKADTILKANAAQTAAETYALAEAKAKADAALVLANSDATTKANAAKSAAEATAALDAKNKADKALADAKLDATAKANAAKTYADGIVKTLKTEVDSKATITQLNTVKNDANQALASAKTELTGNYTKAIEDIEVGGRNLHLDSQLGGNFNSNNGAVSPFSIQRFTDYSAIIPGTSSISTYSGVFIELVPNTFYTVSLEVKAEVDGITIGFYAQSSTNISVPTDKWAKIEHTFNSGSGGRLRVNGLIGTGVIGKALYVKNYKFEKGNKATDWTPAPEDTDKKLVETNAAITAEASTRATEDGALSTRITNTEAVANNAQARVGTVETAVATNTGAIAQTSTKIQAAINNLEIGAKNLIANSNDIVFNGADGNGNDGRTVTATNNEYKYITAATNGYVYGFATVIDQLYPNEYTFSIEVYTNFATSMFFRLDGSKDGQIRIPNTGDKWQRVDFTFTVYTRLPANHGFLLGFESLPAGNTIHWRGIQLVKGNKATSWTPAPEDAKKAIQGTVETINRVEATVSGIKAEASVLTTVGNKVSGWKNLNTGATSNFDIWADRFTVWNGYNNIAPFIINGSSVEINVPLRANSLITSPIISGGTIMAGTFQGGQIAIGNETVTNNGVITKANFMVTSDGVVTAKAGRFEGTVLANKLEGKVANIADLSVDTLQIADYAVTLPVFYDNPNQQYVTGTGKSNTWVSIAKAVFPAVGASVTLTFGIDELRAQAAPQPQNPPYYEVYLALTRNGAELKKWRLQGRRSDVTGGYIVDEKLMYFPTFMDTEVSTTPVTYEVKMIALNFHIAGGGAWVISSNFASVKGISLTAMAMKK